MIAVVFCLAVLLAMGVGATHFHINELMSLNFSAGLDHVAQGGEIRSRSIIGNKNFLPGHRIKYDGFEVPTLPTNHSVRIMIYTVWVGAPLLHDRLNHKYYAEHFGYDYVHVYMNQSDFKQNFGNAPFGWAGVEVGRILLRLYPDVRYFLKLDVDCLFARTDLPLETVLDPYEQYDIYVNQIEHSRFTQSHTYLLKNSKFTATFLDRWSAFRPALHCIDVAQEQGAFHFMIGRTMKEAYGNRVTEFDCDRFCHLAHRSAYHHHHCVLDWYADNNFSISGIFAHPNIFLYSFPVDRPYVSPDDGFTFNGPNSVTPLFSPLTLHPCKRNPYLHPSFVVTSC